MKDILVPCALPQRKFLATHSFRVYEMGSSHDLVERRLVFLSDSGGGHDAGLSARLARGSFMG